MVSQETWIRRIKNDLHVLRSYNSDIGDANKEWLEMVKLWQRFKEWLIIRQSKKFAEELKRKNYKPRQPWDVGIW